MSKLVIRGFLVLVVALECCFGNAAAADTLDVRYGIDGRYRIGRWMPVRVIPTGQLERIEIGTLDGDGVRVVQPSSVEEATGAEGRGVRRYTPAGPQGAPLEVRAFAGGEAPLIWRTRLNTGGVPIARPWVVAIGDSLGLDAVGENELLGISGSVEVSLVRDAAELPDEWFGYDGVDLVVVSAAGEAVLRAMSAEQGRALAAWIRGGGRLLVTLGERSQQTLAAADWLGPLAGITGEPQLARAEPGDIETFIVARDPISPFQATRLSADTGLVLLAGRSVEGGMLPLVLRRNVGFGLVTVVAADLDAAPFAEWKQRDDFVQRILPGLVPPRVRNETRGSADVRYSELAGQLRSTLDRFAGADRARFSLVAAILLVLVGLIGPLDFFLVNRWVGRPLVGWISFPLTIVAFSAAILLWRGSVAERQVRQVSVIDIDPTSGVGRGFAWAQVFSGEADRLDLQIVTDSQFGTGRSPAALTSPWGYAGEVFGGIQVAGEDVRLPAYALRLDRQAPPSAGPLPGDSVSGAAASAESPAGASSPTAASSPHSSLLGVPLAPLSSKGIAGRWRFEVPSGEKSSLLRQPGSDLLNGSFTNPLPVDVLDGLLIYRNTVFLLPTRLPAGGRIAAIEAVQAKNFRWRLNRRQTGETSSQSEPWDRAEDRDLGRLMEIVLFFQAAGGAQYTELENRTLADLDLSHALTADRAILVGRLAASPATVQINGRAAEPPEFEADTFVRVVLPVQTSLSNP